MQVNNAFLEGIVHDLPIIRPIKEFIHLNLLLPYQHKPFWTALSEVSRKLEANPFPEQDYYQEKIRSGEIPVERLKKKLSTLGQDPEGAFKKIMDEKFEFVHQDSRIAPLHNAWNDLLGINIIQLADSMLIKWLSMFLDQGIGHWQMPESGEKNFYNCIRELLASSLLLPEPFSRNEFSSLFPVDRDEAIRRHLDYLCPEKHLQSSYTKEAVMTLRGWAGLIYTVESSPQLLPFRRNISLMDFLATKLVLERAWIQTELRNREKPDFGSVRIMQEQPIPESFFLLFRACQETLEESSHDKLIQNILQTKKDITSPSVFQAVFCMDDRESLLRRFLEGSSSDIETFGTAGHFGIECLYQHPEDAFPKKQCPAPLAPKVSLKDIYKKDSPVRKTAFTDVQPTGSLFHDWLFSHFSSLTLTVKLFVNTFFPLAFKSVENVKEVELNTDLIIEKTDQLMESEELPGGYSPSEMTDLVYQQLLLMGLVHHFAHIIFIIGHGSQTENNPYYATYGCGACSGRPGAANARAFVKIANNKDVRKGLFEKYRLLIPDDTFFISGLHDTCRDTVEFYDVWNLPQKTRDIYEKFKAHLSQALFNTAKERARAFKLVSYQTLEKDAQKEVLKRSSSLFETRPELGHTNVAYAVVGRRELTSGIIPDRPSFFQSYDPSIDPEGKLLEVTLGAVIPVCSGINLDYYFSRVDNLRFGAGSKLPQNIVGNFGISHGTESDLLFGLPLQMIDQHQPLRLLVMVEQEPQIALKSIQNNPLVRQIVYNEWIYYCCLSPLDDKVYFFKDGMMVKKERV